MADPAQSGGSGNLKSGIIAKMLPPQSRAVAVLARETGILKDTLYSWRTLAVKAGDPAAPRRREARRG